MWQRSYSKVTNKVSKEQLWTLFSDVNNWHTWDDSIEYARMKGKFEKGNYFILRPKGGPNVRIELVETVKNYRFTDLTRFPLAKMYGDHLFEESPEGLKLTITMTVTGILGFLWVKLVAGKIADSMHRDVENQIEAAGKIEIKNS